MNLKWKKLAELAGTNGKPFNNASSDLFEAASKAEVNIDMMGELYPENYLDLYGYRLFPPAMDLVNWNENNEGWRESWFPLSSNYHNFILFLDHKSGEIRRVSLDNLKDEEGFLEGDETVYSNFDAFLKVVLANYRWITKGAFSISVEGFFKEEVAILLPEVVAGIKKETVGIEGPIILPFFEGTLGPYNSLAEIDSKK